MSISGALASCACISVLCASTQLTQTPPADEEGLVANVQRISSLESTLRTLTWFLPGASSRIPSR